MEAAVSINIHWYHWLVSGSKKCCQIKVCLTQKHGVKHYDRHVNNFFCLSTNGHCNQVRLQILVGHTPLFYCPIACANAQLPAQTTTPQTFQSTTQNKAACLYFAIREFDTLYTNSVLVIAMKKKRQIWSSSRLAASDGNKDAPTTWTKQNVFSLFNCNVFIPNIIQNISRLKLLSCMQLICNIRAPTQFILEMLFLLGVVMRQCAHGLNRGVVP